MARRSIPDTHVLMVVDRSGSMSFIRDTVVGQMNDFLGDRLNDPGRVFVTFTQFDHEFDIVFEALPAARVPVIGKEYQPRGSTALYDAIARGISVVETHVKSGQRVLVCIVTDGQENASTEYSLFHDGKNKIKQLIEQYQGRGNWTFTYLSGDLNAIPDATSIGIMASNVAQFDPTKAGYTQGSNMLRNSTRVYTNSVASSSETFYNPDES